MRSDGKSTGALIVPSNEPQIALLARDKRVGADFRQITAHQERLEVKIELKRTQRTKDYFHKRA